MHCAIFALICARQNNYLCTHTQWGFRGGHVSIRPKVLILVIFLGQVIGQTKLSSKCPLPPPPNYYLQGCRWVGKQGQLGAIFFQNQWFSYFYQFFFKLKLRYTNLENFQNNISSFFCNLLWRTLVPSVSSKRFVAVFLCRVFSWFHIMFSFRRTGLPMVKCV